MTHLSDAIPIATPDEPTQLLVCEEVDAQTLRIRFCDVSPDISDGIPTAVEGERSATTAVRAVDMLEPLEFMAQMARRDGIGVIVTPMPSIANPQEIGVIAIMITTWRSFQSWFFYALRELRDYLVSRFGDRVADALLFRLKLLSKDVLTRMPPKHLNTMILRLEP